ncbi:MAG: preprotein translocase subunit SecE, partial [Solirubrobacterales bacterium]
DQRRADKEQARKARESAERRAPKEVKVERERNVVMGFFASVIAELRKVQWPDRDTLVQASAVTLLFVAVAATYLGVLDAIFGWLVDRLIT